MIEKIALPLLHMMDAEKAHTLTMAGLKSGLVTDKRPITCPLIIWSRFSKPCRAGRGIR